MRIDPDIGRCDLCGNEDGERVVMLWHDVPVWVDEPCRTFCEPLPHSLTSPTVVESDGELLELDAFLAAREAHHDAIARDEADRAADRYERWQSA